ARVDGADRFAVAGHGTLADQQVACQGHGASFAEGQHYRIAGMNLLAAIIIFWNTMKLGEVVANQKRDGKLLSPDLLAHVSPLGWEHINLTGEYRWPKP
ncbi:Tn3 family transposase, partial [Pseudomonas soli]|uniref:Tn3 family transposase n=1 Tax=Pseudomonas soli TaxID=1306993 RepID=UPI003D023366